MSNFFSRSYLLGVQVIDLYFSCILHTQESVVRGDYYTTFYYFSLRADASLVTCKKKEKMVMLGRKVPH